MKKIMIALVALISIQSAALAQATIKDANAQVREAKNFNAIRLSSAFDVYLTQGNEESVAVSASDSKYMDDIIVEVRNGQLDISYRPKGGRWSSGNRKLKAYVSFKQLSRLEVSGACNVDVVGGWKADDLKIVLSGASDLKVNLDAKKLTLDLSGASDIKASGLVANLNIDASGASSFKGFDLAADFCDVHASGASSIRITVNKELSAQASGASDVDYRGAGMIRDIKTSGASSVSKKNS